MVKLTVFSLLYLSFYLCLVLGILEGTSGPKFWQAVFRRWAKLLGGLLAIGLVVQILTWVGG